MKYASESEFLTKVKKYPSDCISSGDLPSISGNLPTMGGIICILLGNSAL